MRHAALATGAAVVVGWPWAAPPYFVFLASLIAINAIVAIGLNLLSGYTNQLSFGHAGFLAIGAYAAAILTIRAPALPVPASLLLAGLVTAAVGFALGVHFDSVAHSPKTLDEVPLFTHNSRELTVG